MFRLHVSVLGKGRQMPVCRGRVGRVLPMPVRESERTAQNNFLKARVKPVAMRMQASANNGITVEPADIRRLLTETDRHFRILGKTLSRFVTLVLGEKDGYERYLKRQAQQLRTRGKPWSRMTAKQLRDDIRATLVADLNEEYLRGEKTAWFVRPSYRGNPVRVYRNVARNTEFCFVLAADHPKVIGIFPMGKFLSSDRMRGSRRRSMLRQPPSIAS